MKKKSNISTILFLAIITLILSGCSGGALTDNSGNNATITINVGGIENRSIWLHDDAPGALDDILFKVILSGPEHREFEAKGREPISITVAPGIWNINIEASYNNYLYATGSVNNVQVRAGQNNTVHITMLPPHEYYHGLIRGYDGRGERLHGIYLTSLAYFEDFEQVNNIGIISQGGNFSLSLKSVPVNNLISLYDYVNDENYYGVTIISSTKINVDSNVMATKLLPMIESDNEVLYLVHGNDYTYSYFVYANSAVVVQGNREVIFEEMNGNRYTNRFEWNMTLRQGWNLVYYTETENNRNYTTRITSARPSGVEWMLSCGGRAGGGGGSGGPGEPPGPGNNVEIIQFTFFWTTVSGASNNEVNIHILSDLLKSIKDPAAPSQQHWNWEDEDGHLVEFEDLEEAMLVDFPIGIWKLNSGNDLIFFTFYDTQAFVATQLIAGTTSIIARGGWHDVSFDDPPSGQNHTTGIIMLQFDFQGGATNPPNPSIRFRR
jgi:hypothetical protein